MGSRYPYVWPIVDGNLNGNIFRAPTTQIMDHGATYHGRAICSWHKL
jgi:hypothetical protein